MEMNSASKYEACASRIEEIVNPVYAAYSDHHIVRQKHKQSLPQEISRFKSQFDSSMKSFRDYLKDIPESEKAQRAASRYHEKMISLDWHDLKQMRSVYRTTSLLRRLAEKNLNQ